MSITFNLDGSVILADDADPTRGVTIAAGTTPASRDAQIAAFFGPPPLPPMPDLSDRQFARGLWGDGIITYADFLGFVGPGVIPPAVLTILADLPDSDATDAPTPRKEAIGFLTGAKTYVFAHPLVETFRQAMAKRDPIWTPDYLRARWLVWATL